MTTQEANRGLYSPAFEHDACGIGTVVDIQGRPSHQVVDDALKIAGSKHDLVGIRVYDPRETELPDVGIVELKDAESGRKVWVDTSSRAVRDHYAASWQRRSGEIEATLKHNRIDTAMISTDGDYVAELIKLFKQR